ncbi:MAG: glycogen/starch/alpha-glucan phosphorylase, partial [Pseudomonadota bacterium]|nr:glycogen/starch/alpha-glucan phosphorylase [Pseudomonadota bacterium]
ADSNEIRGHLAHYMMHMVGKLPDTACPRDWFQALSYFLRGLLAERAAETDLHNRETGAKRVYYLSMEYLLGRSLRKNLIDLGLETVVSKVLDGFGVSLAEVEAIEADAALGSGGLGRLAACFLDSMATHGHPGMAYGIRFEYGLFTQAIKGGQQVEQPEPWLRYGNPWEFKRFDDMYMVRFFGKIESSVDRQGRQFRRWASGEKALAIAHDIPIAGFGTSHVSSIRLWSAQALEDFDLSEFSEGNYIKAVDDKTISESLSKVLYPQDANPKGQELRLKQEYFFVSASVQDILGRHFEQYETFDNLPDKVIIHLNDTHPALAIPEFLRILVDHHEYELKKAWALTRRVFAYTNHTLMTEALEVWPLDLIRRMLPRHIEIIYDINLMFLQEVSWAFPNDNGKLYRMSLIDDHAGRVRMSHMAIIASSKVNGVAALHSDLMKASIFKDFAELYPDRFINITNGITPRRWLRQANPPLAQLVTEAVGEGWERDLDMLEGLAKFADDTGFQDKFRAVKRAAKMRLATLIEERLGAPVMPDAMFDIQVKRIHEYKRQLLNVLHVITRYNCIRDGRCGEVPRVVVFAGKAAPSYFMAKRIIRLINDVSYTVNNDPAVSGRLKVFFLCNYNVTLAETIIPASDISQHISVAGTEASGTGNMKFCLNGGSLVGTLDGANIEIKDAVGDDNIFIFGHTAKEVAEINTKGYNPWNWINENEDLKRAIDMIGEGYFSLTDPMRHKPISDALTEGGDRFHCCADYASYIACQREVDHAFANAAGFAAKGIRNMAGIGRFSSDRSMDDYARLVWHTDKVNGNGNGNGNDG